MLNDGGTTTAQPSLIKKHITHVHTKLTTDLTFLYMGLPENQVTPCNVWGQCVRFNITSWGSIEAARNFTFSFPSSNLGPLIMAKGSFFLKKLTFWMKQTRMAKICVAGAGSFVPKLGPFWNGCGSIFPTPHSRFSIYLYARWIWLTICIHPWYLRLEQQLQSLHSWIVGSGKFVAAVRSGQIGKDRPLPNWVHSRISVTFEGA